jgi:uncharacterized protein YkwD
LSPRRENPLSLGREPVLSAVEGRVRVRVRGFGVLLGFIFLVLLAAACKTGGHAATGSSASDAANASADRVIVSTLAPEPTRTREPATPAQAPAATLAAAATSQPSTATPPPGTSTPRPSPSATPSPTITPTPPSSPTPGPTITGSTPLSAREQYLFDAHNAERLSRSLSPLTLDPTLEAIARTRAQVMADNHLFSHYNPNGDNVYDMLDDAGYPWQDATENIHWNDFAASQADSIAMSEYMASAAHRANILKPGFNRVGVGVATSAAGVHYYSVVFSD